MVMDTVENAVYPGKGKAVPVVAPWAREYPWPTATGPQLGPSLADLVSPTASSASSTPAQAPAQHTDWGSVPPTTLLNASGVLNHYGPFWTPAGFGPDGHVEPSGGWNWWRANHPVVLTVDFDRVLRHAPHFSFDQFLDGFETLVLAGTLQIVHEHGSLMIPPQNTNSSKRAPHSSLGARLEQHSGMVRDLMAPLGLEFPRVLVAYLFQLLSSASSVQTTVDTVCSRVAEDAASELPSQVILPAHGADQPRLLALSFPTLPDERWHALYQALVGSLQNLRDLPTGDAGALVDWGHTLFANAAACLVEPNSHTASPFSTQYLGALRPFRSAVTAQWNQNGMLDPQTTQELDNFPGFSRLTWYAPTGGGDRDRSHPASLLATRFALAHAVLVFSERYPRPQLRPLIYPSLTQYFPVPSNSSPWCGLARAWATLLEARMGSPSSQTRAPGSTGLLGAPTRGRTGLAVLPGLFQLLAIVAGDTALGQHAAAGVPSIRPWMLLKQLERLCELGDHDMSGGTWVGAPDLPGPMSLGVSLDGVPGTSRARRYHDYMLALYFEADRQPWIPWLAGVDPVSSGEYIAQIRQSPAGSTRQPTRVTSGGWPEASPGAYLVDRPDLDVGSGRPIRFPTRPTDRRSADTLPPPLVTRPALRPEHMVPTGSARNHARKVIWTHQAAPMDLCGRIRAGLWRRMIPRRRMIPVVVETEDASYHYRLPDGLRTFRQAQVLAVTPIQHNHARHWFTRPSYALHEYYESPIPWNERQRPIVEHLEADWPERARAYLDKEGREWWARAAVSFGPQRYLGLSVAHGPASSAPEQGCKTIDRGLSSTGSSDQRPDPSLASGSGSAMDTAGHQLTVDQSLSLDRLVALATGSVQASSHPTSQLYTLIQRATWTPKTLWEPCDPVRYSREGGDGVAWRLLSPRQYEMVAEMTGLWPGALQRFFTVCLPRTVLHHDTVTSPPDGTSSSTAPSNVLEDGAARKVWARHQLAQRESENPTAQARLVQWVDTLWFPPLELADGTLVAGDQDQPLANRRRPLPILTDTAVQVGLARLVNMVLGDVVLRLNRLAAACGALAFPGLSCRSAIPEPRAPLPTPGIVRVLERLARLFSTVSPQRIRELKAFTRPESGSAGRYATSELQNWRLWQPGRLARLVLWPLVPAFLWQSRILERVSPRYSAAFTSPAPHDIFPSRAVPTPLSSSLSRSWIPPGLQLVDVLEKLVNTATGSISLRALNHLRVAHSPWVQDLLAGGVLYYSPTTQAFRLPSLAHRLAIIQWILDVKRTWTAWEHLVYLYHYWIGVGTGGSAPFLRLFATRRSPQFPPHAGVTHPPPPRDGHPRSGWSTPDPVQIGSVRPKDYMGRTNPWTLPNLQYILENKGTPSTVPANTSVGPSSP